MGLLFNSGRLHCMETIKRCTISDADCIAGRLRRGMCERHYRRFMSSGSTQKSSPVQHLKRYAKLSNGCWEWIGPLYRNGYGNAGVNGLAHRYFYRELVGPIPVGMELDHECHSLANCVGGFNCPHRRCVNPAHLKPVRHQENVARVIERKQCRKGHDLTVGGARSNSGECVECWRVRYRKAGVKYRQKKKGR